MRFTALDITGCVLVEPLILDDNRGSFAKTYQSSVYLKHHIDFQIHEEFLSISHKNVLRGMHFQLPPFEHDKLVCCLAGTVIDGFVDLRRGSPTYKHSQIVKLTGKGKENLFLPKGVAHGFYTLSDSAVMLYRTSSEHDPRYDSGVHWQTCGINWPISNPILSERDQRFPELECFESPFYFNPR